MLKLKLQYFGHLMWRADSFEKTLMLGKIEGRRRRERQMRGWDGWMASLTQWVWVNSGSCWWTGRPGALQSMGLQKSWTRLSDWTALHWNRKNIYFFSNRTKAINSIDHWRRLSYLSLLFFGTLHSNMYIFTFLLCLLLLFLSWRFVRPPQATILPFCISFCHPFFKYLYSQRIQHIKKISFIHVLRNTMNYNMIFPSK